MLLATDVHYDEAGDRAAAAMLLFTTWSDTAATIERVRMHHGLAPYVPGAFYQRELPALLPLLLELARAHPLEAILIDGYVDLGAAPGLGRHLAHALQQQGLNAPIIGVAKSRFAGADSGAGAVQLLRGTSQQPLFITAAGLDAAAAARSIAAMHGEHRIPTLLRRVDRLARDHLQPK